MRGADSKSLFASDWALSEALGEGERTVFLWEMELLVGLLILYIPWCLAPSLRAPTHTWVSTNWTWGALIIKMKKVMKSLGRAATNFCHSILSQVKLNAYHWHTTLSLLCSVRMRVYAGVFTHALGGQRKMLRVFSYCSSLLPRDRIALQIRSSLFLLGWMASELLMKGHWSTRAWGSGRPCPSPPSPLPY